MHAFVFDKKENSLLLDVFNNEILAEDYIKYMKEEGEIFAPRSTEETLVSGSTDFGNISYQVPGLHPG